MVPDCTAEVTAATDLHAVAGELPAALSFPAAERYQVRLAAELDDVDVAERVRVDDAVGVPVELRLKVDVDEADLVKDAEDVLTLEILPVADLLREADSVPVAVLDMVRVAVPVAEPVADAEAVLVLEKVLVNELLRV